MANFNREREAEIERRVTRRIQRRMLLMANFMLMFFYMSLISGRFVDEVFRVMGVFWVMAFIVHTALVVYWEWSERAVRRALEQERNAYYRAIAETVLAELQDEKPKRRERLSLTDDGELTDAPEYDEREYRKRR